ncbi:hypothetical protein MF271_24090 (plasmid) [Deinococcus sp. KNUC1210]|uniref:DUF6504 family protein n=1 Tax=Deinococcus sp. KNUC1210 TaxID=2917691 RepID=UPI001EF0CEF6|nr:DUF6504 family protein [Deinococcus sp. KNUC1210]ULH18044.1 hypothetical protein MF271_24090 [Deinococcus sp. KNUC1210]
MKAILELIEVQIDPQGLPRRFRFRHQVYTITAVVEGWLYGGQWWRKESPRRCYRVEAGRLTAELHVEDRPGGRWWLAAIQD